MQISDKAIELIKDNLAVTGRLISAFGKHQNTIQRWYHEKNPLLTTATAIQIITEETGLPEDEILVADNTVSA